MSVDPSIGRYNPKHFGPYLNNVALYNKFIDICIRNVVNKELLFCNFSAVFHFFCSGTSFTFLQFFFTVMIIFLSYLFFIRYIADTSSLSPKISFPSYRKLVSKS